MVRFFRVVIFVILFAGPVSLFGQGRRGTPPPTQTPPQTQAPPAGRAGQTPAQNPNNPASPDQQTPTFRAATVLVPVDVRVIDRRTGKPVTDLRQDEFVVTENNVRQQIKLFSTQALVPDESAASAPLARVTTAPTTLSPQTRRTFLIVLGRGRLNTWSSALEGLAHLVRERLLPQDYVAVMAFNRATEFTTDHERVAAVIDRFRKAGGKADAQLNLYGQSAGQFAGGYIPKAVQAQVDAIFKGPENAPIKSVAPAPVANAARISSDQRNVGDSLRNDERAAQLDPNFVPNPLDPSNGIEMSFDDYVSTATQTSQDLGKLYSGVAYLRYLDGEKHMIFVTERGLMLPRAEDDDGLAATAADARVVIDIFHTGGAAVPVNLVSSAGRGRGNNSGRLQGDWRLTTSRAVAAQTGGTFALSESGKDFADKLDTATRFSYLLGYYPANPNWDGAYRRLKVQITRPGAYDVQFRHGYMANLEMTPLDRPKALAYTRVAGAASTPDAITDLTLGVTATNVSDNGSWVDVAVIISPEQLTFSEKDGKRSAAVDVAVFCADDKDRMLGERWTTSDLSASDGLAKAQSKLRYNTRVQVTSPARVVKVVVYDRNGDRLGSITVKLDPTKNSK